MAEKSTKKAAAKKVRKPAKRIVKLARKKATEQGRDWKALSLDERKAMRKQVREGLKSKRADNKEEPAA